MKQFPDIVLPIRDSRRMPGWERLDIYANMYFFRILDSLKEDFPGVLKTIGDDRFHHLTTDYLARHFPSHWSLRDVGRFLPSFLKNYSPTKKWPSLSDLARFEWALIEAFDAADAPTLTEEDIKTVRPDRWPGLRFCFVPSCFLMNFSWPVDRILEKAMKGKRLPVRREKTPLVIWRKNLRVCYRSLPFQEARLLSGIERGESFGALCAGLPTAPRMASYLRDWLQAGFFRRREREGTARSARRPMRMVR